MVCAFFFAFNSRSMHLFQAPLDTSLNSPRLCQSLSSQFALHGLRALESSWSGRPVVVVSGGGDQDVGATETDEDTTTRPNASAPVVVKNESPTKICPKTARKYHIT